ncbi:MAG: hypothetical protein EOO52_12760 [Gammaproteobacteria bacterium]|nr:MAG: hypothetical protein EOO52_12760 [Gammaproteobacteria bacterium]
MIEHLLFIGVCCAVTWLLARKWSNKTSKASVARSPFRASQRTPVISESHLGDLIDAAEKLSRRGCVNVNVVRMKSGSMQLLSDFQLTVQKKEVAELVFSTDETRGHFVYDKMTLETESASVPMAA